MNPRNRRTPMDVKLLAIAISLAGHGALVAGVYFSGI